MNSPFEKYSRDQIKQFVNDGICPVQTLRDYDIVQAKMQGKHLEHIAEDNRVSRAQVYNIVSKYLKRNGIV